MFMGDYGLWSINILPPRNAIETEIFGGARKIFGLSGKQSGGALHKMGNWRW